MPTAPFGRRGPAPWTRCDPAYGSQAIVLRVKRRLAASGLALGLAFGAMVPRASGGGAQPSARVWRGWHPDGPPLPRSGRPWRRVRARAYRRSALGGGVRAGCSLGVPPSSMLRTGSRAAERDNVLTARGSRLRRFARSERLCRRWSGARPNMGCGRHACSERSERLRYAAEWQQLEEAVQDADEQRNAFRSCSGNAGNISREMGRRNQEPR